MELIKRREFVKDVSIAGLSLLAASIFLGGCEDILAKIRNRPVRRCIRDADIVNEQIEIYKAAVAAMKALPSSDPRNWSNQATIHNNFCPHGNWFFFPWHRVYLFYFEEICRELTGEPSFGLPYWDWCVHPSIPSQFWGSGNPLNNATRVATASSVASSASVGLPLVNGYCNEPNFNIFAGGSAASLRPTAPRVYGNVEGTPHNYIHGTFIRGDMATFMSPLDPIFWSHHCMVDVCWYEWNILRSHPNTNDASWLNFDYSGMFVDGQGNPATMTTVVSLLLPLLSYRYETGINCEVVADLGSITKSDKQTFEATKKVIQKGAPVKLKIKKRIKVSSAVTMVPGSGNKLDLSSDIQNITDVITRQKDSIILTIKEVIEPKETDLFLRVFINKKDADRFTKTTDPHFAGSFFFFSHSKNAEAVTVDFTVDITETLRKLKSSGELGDDNLFVSLVVVPVDQNDKANYSLGISGIEAILAEKTVLLSDIN